MSNDREEKHDCAEVPLFYGSRSKITSINETCESRSFTLLVSGGARFAEGSFGGASKNARPSPRGIRNNRRAKEFSLAGPK